MQEQEKEEFEYVKEKIVRPGFFKRIRKKAGLIFGAILFAAVCILGTLYATELKKSKDEKEQTTQKESYLAIPTVKDTMHSKKDTTMEGEKSKKELGVVSIQIKKSVVDISVYSAEEAKVGQKPDAVTSGVIIKKGVNVLILTDYSTVHDGKRIEVTFGKDMCYEAKVKKDNSSMGIAILSVSGTEVKLDSLEEMPEVQIGNASWLREGQQLIYIGSPIDASLYTDSGNVTGLSKMNYVDGQVDIVQTNIPLAGTANGFLFNVEGELVGILNENLPEAKVCVAAFMNQLTPTVEKLINGVARPYLGINGEAVTDEIIEKTGEKMPYGVYVENVMKSSPAYEAGIRNGDIIYQIGSTDVMDMDDIRNILDEVSAGDRVTVMLKRYDVGTYRRYSYEVILEEGK